LGDGGEGDAGQAGDVAVVVADQRQVVGYADAATRTAARRPAAQWSLNAVIAVGRGPAAS
jgi:hypothetical protein